MYGNDIGSLNIRTLSDGGVLSLPFWTRAKNYGDKWNVGQTTVSSVGTYSIVFEGIVGASWLGDIAIDDVFVVDGECQPDGYCSFESSNPRLCTWENENSEFKIIEIKSFSSFVFG